MRTVPIWAIMSVIEDDIKETLLEKIKGLQADFPFVGLRAVVVPVLDMV